MILNQPELERIADLGLDVEITIRISGSGSVPLSGELGPATDLSVKVATGGSGRTDARDEFMPALNDELDIWVADLERLDKDARTIKQYRASVVAIAGSNEWRCVAEFTKTGIRGRLTELAGLGRSPATQMNNLSAIKSFVLYHRGEEAGGWFSGAGKIKTPKRVIGNDGEKRALSIDETRAFFEAVRESRRGYDRDWVYLAMVGTGLRRGVWTDYHNTGDCMRIGDLDLNHKGETGWEPRLTVRPEIDKGGRRWVLPISEEVAEILFRAIDGRAHKTEDPVFPKAPTSATFQKDLVRAGIKGQGAKLSAHALRYTFNTTLALMEVPLPVRQQLMCHRAQTVTDTVYLSKRSLWPQMVEAVRGLPRFADLPVLERATGKNALRLAIRDANSQYVSMRPVISTATTPDESGLMPDAGRIKSDREAGFAGRSTHSHPSSRPIGVTGFEPATF